MFVAISRLIIHQFGPFKKLCTRICMLYRRITSRNAALVFNVVKNRVFWVEICENRSFWTPRSAVWCVNINQVRRMKIWQRILMVIRYIVLKLQAPGINTYGGRSVAIWSLFIISQMTSLVYTTQISSIKIAYEPKFDKFSHDMTFWDLVLLFYKSLTRRNIQNNV